MGTFRTTVALLLTLGLFGSQFHAADAQTFAPGTGSASHDLDDASADILLHLQQNHSGLTTVISTTKTLGTESDLFHDFVHDVENMRNNRTIAETPCEFHRLFRAFLDTNDQYTMHWATLSADTTFMAKYNVLVTEGAKLANLLLSVNPRIVYLMTRECEGATHDIDDEAAALLLHLQQNYTAPQYATAVSLAMTFASEADAYHDHLHDVGKCQQPFTSVKAEHTKLMNAMVALAQELYRVGVLPNDRTALGIAQNALMYYLIHTNSAIGGGIL